MRIIEGENDHLPLPGPWNRPRGENRGPARGAPGQPEGRPYRSEEEGEDSPLPGPWSRRERQPGPGHPAPGMPPDIPEDQPPDPGQQPPEERWPDPEPDRRPGQRPKLRREPRPEQESPPQEQELPRPAEDAGYAAGPPAREAGPAPAPAVEAGEVFGGEISGGPAERVDKPIRDVARSPEGQLRKIFSPGGIYAGIVMAEVLGSRGGRPRRR